MEVKKGNKKYMTVMEQFSIHQKIKSSIFSEKFINLLLIHGKKSKASLVYISTLELLNHKLLTYLEKNL